jgi:hypothetical protein
MAQRSATPEFSAAVGAAAVAHAEVALQAAQDAVAGVAALLDAAAAEEALQVAAAAAGAVPRAWVEEVARQPAARPSAVLLLELPSAWAFRRGPVLPWLAPQPAARRSAHAMADLRIASP